MIAARLLGLAAIGLGSLVEKFAGVPVAKAGQKSDWSRRPLTSAQLRYAVDDTRYLEPLADLLLAGPGPPGPAAVVRRELRGRHRGDRGHPPGRPASAHGA